jgi:antibiotic biosynthesis monooxygenase (ABM) superfamily enzyme
MPLQLSQKGKPKSGVGRSNETSLVILCSTMVPCYVTALLGAPPKFAILDKNATIMLRTSLERVVSSLGNSGHIELGDEGLSPTDAGENRVSRPPAVSAAVPSVEAEEEKRVPIPVEPKLSTGSSDDSSGGRSTICSIVARVKLVSPDKLPDYEKVLEEMAEYCHSKFKGHLYSGLVEQTKTGNLVSVHRFDTVDHLQIWMTSEERRKFLERFAPLVVPESVHVDVVEGATHLFEVSDGQQVPGSVKPDMRPPPQWKVLVLLIAVFYPLVLILGVVLVAPLAKAGYSSITITAIVYAIVLPIGFWALFPAIFKIFRKWLMKPRPVYPRHSLMFILDSGFSVFKPVNPDLVNPVQEATINRISVAEGLISSIQERLRLLEHQDKISDAEMDQMIAYKDGKSHQIIHVLRDKIVAEAAREHNENYPVSVKVALKVPPAYTKSYEKFAKDIGRAAAQFEGFLGFDVIRPSELDAKGSGVYVSITRFQTHSQLLKWLTSRERKELLVQIHPFVTVLSGDIESDKFLHTNGFDNFFQSTAPTGAEIDSKQIPAPPPKWKTCALTFVILLGNSAFFSTFIAPIYSKQVPSLLATFITLCLNLTLSSYVVTPFANKIFQDWLHTYTQNDVPKSWIGKCFYLGFPGLR